MNASKGKTWTTIAVGAVSMFAAVQSFKHIYDLAVTHGDSGPVGMLVPLSVDGLIVAATLALHQTLTTLAKTLAQFALGSAILATILANVIYGLGYGVLGAVINAWPAYAMTLGIEIVILMTAPGRDRSPDRSRTRPESTPESTRESATGPAHESTAPVITRAPREHRVSATRDRSPRAPRERTPAAPVTVEDAEREFMTELAEGQVPSLRQIRARLHVGPDRAKVLLGHLENVMART